MSLHSTTWGGSRTAPTTHSWRRFSLLVQGARLRLATNRPYNPPLAAV